ncbi:MAG: hypothetical protein AMXMBFR13_44740 [Phycisphaerae bacterium]
MWERTCIFGLAAGTASRKGEMKEQQKQLTERDRELREIRAELEALKSVVRQMAGEQQEEQEQ